MHVILALRETREVSVLLVLGFNLRIKAETSQIQSIVLLHTFQVFDPTILFHG